MSLRRICSPTEAREIWSTLEHLHNAGKPATAENIYLETQQTMGWTPSETSLYLSDMVRSEMLVETVQGEAVYRVPTEVNVSSYPPSDWYCFECQGPGTVVACTSCSRVYHEQCLTPGAYVHGIEFVCHWCRMIRQRMVFDREFGKQKLTQVLVLALAKAGSHFTQLPGHNWPYSMEQYRLLVATHMDLDEMQRKIDINAYSNEKEFLYDFHVLRHNVIIMCGLNSVYAPLVMDLLCDVDAQLEVFSREGMEMRNSESTSEPGVTGDSRLKVEDMLCESDVSVHTTEPCNCEAEKVGVAATTALQEIWRSMYIAAREKLCVAYLAKLNGECDTERDRMRVEMINQFKAELESTKRELDKQYAQKLKVEVQRLMENHRFEVSHTKKTQWCCLCGNEAIYHCCWNTSYCSVKCQHESWGVHKKLCRRKKDS